MIYKLDTGTMYRRVADVEVVKEEEVLEFLKETKTIALDIETCFSYENDRIYKISKKLLSELNCFDHKILLIQLGTLDTQYIIDVRETAPSNILNAIQKNKIKVVGQNLLYDLHWLKWHYGFSTENVYDTMLVEKILTNGLYEMVRGAYALNGIYDRYYNINIESRQTNLFEPRAPKKTRDQFPGITDEALSIEFLTYCRYDVIIPLRIKEAQEKHPDFKTSKKVLKLELTYLLVLVDMKLRGPKIDEDKWDIVLNEASGALLVLREELAALNDINWNSPQQRLKAFEELGVNLVDRKGKASASAESLKLILEALDEEGEIWNMTKLLLNYGKVSKQVSTYGSKFLKAINRTTGEIHSDFQQLKISGRTSSTNPKLYWAYT